MTQPLFLVGARGCGKTTVGRVLAKTLGYKFVDTDKVVLDRAGKTIADIVAEEGWSGFRLRESDALQCVASPLTVVATGGGMVLSEQNRQFMLGHGIAIWLHAPAPVLTARLAAFADDALRPTLTGKTITDEMEEVLAAREAYYRQVARYTVDATQPPAAVVDAIIHALQLAYAS